MTERIKQLSSKLFSTGFFHIFSSSVINKIISFASGIVLVRIISKGDYGVFSYANNILSFFILASGMGALSGVLQMGSESDDAEKRKNIYSYGCKVSFFSNIVLTVIIVVVAIFVPFELKGANECLAAMAFLPAVMYLYEMQGIFLRSELRNKEFAISNTVSTVVIFVLSCLLSYFLGVNGLIAAKYISAVIAFVFIALRYKVAYPIGTVAKLDTETKKTFWEISGISMLNNGLSRLMYLLDVFVIGLLIPDSTVVASYQVATNIPNALAFIPAAVLTYAYPYFAKRKDDKAWVLKRYKQLSIVMGICCFLIAAFLFITAPWVIRFLFGVSYLDAVPAFRVLCASFAITSTFRILPGNILVTQRCLKFNLFVSIISSALNMGLNFIFVSHYNSVGAAYATIITTTVTSIISVSYLVHILKKDKTDYERGK